MITKLRHEKLSYVVRGAMFDVHNALGMGWSEDVFHQGLAQRLTQLGIAYLSKPRKTLFHRDEKVHEFECDLLVKDTVILELKMLPFTDFAPAHYSQLIHYLKCWQKDLGMLVNFGQRSVRIKRFVWDEPAHSVQDFTKTNSPLSEQIKKIASTVYQSYGLGYPETVYRSILALEISGQEMLCEKDVVISRSVSDSVQIKQTTPYLLVEEELLIKVTSLMENASYFHREQMRNFTKVIGLEQNLLINFGKNQLEFYSVE